MIDLKIAAVITVYHPNEDVYENILSYSTQLPAVYLFDNSEQAGFIKEKIGRQHNVLYFHTGENNGIAQVLNDAAQMAIKEGYDWLLMMDQDSKFNSDGIGEYMKCVQKYDHYDQVAMFGVNDDENPKNVPAHAEPLITDRLITSGTLLNLSLFKKIGPFDENLFIDGVDHDYAIRVLQTGFKMIRFSHIHLLHSIGNLERRASIKTLYLVKKSKRIHSPIRCYYMYRNLLYLKKKYSNSNVHFLQSLEKATKATLWRNFFYGGNKWELVQYILQAKRDFRNNRMGKIGNA